MKSAELRAAIEIFLDVAFERGAGETREQDLGVALDRLAVARTAWQGTEPDPTDEEVPRPDGPTLRSRLAPRFGSLGLYHAPALDPQACSVGDALDDLTDIALELIHVRDIWDRCGERDALWAFCQNYDAHWGEHLRLLQWYLHEEARQTDEERAPR